MTAPLNLQTFVCLGATVKQNKKLSSSPVFSKKNLFTKNKSDRAENLRHDAKKVWKIAALTQKRSRQLWR